MFDRFHASKPPFEWKEIGATWSQAVPRTAQVDGTARVTSRKEGQLNNINNQDHCVLYWAVDTHATARGVANSDFYSAVLCRLDHNLHS